MPFDPQTLITDANQFNGSPGDMALIKLGLLKTILLNINPMADVSAQTLITQAAEYNTFGPGFWPLIELALLQQIAGGGSSGSSSAITFAAYGGGAPTFTPASGFGAALDTDTRNLWVYDADGWNQLV